MAAEQARCTVHKKILIQFISVNSEASGMEVQSTSQDIFDLSTDEENAHSSLNTSFISSDDWDLNSGTLIYQNCCKEVSRMQYKNVTFQQKLVRKMDGLAKFA
jgi:hypothetical protein